MDRGRCTHRRPSLVVRAIVLVALAGPAPLLAGSTSAQLVVGVTVVRSCVLDAQPAAQTASRLRLECAAGAARGLQMNEGVTRIGGTGRTTELLAPTAPFSPEGSQSQLRVLTVNF